MEKKAIWDLKRWDTLNITITRWDVTTDEIVTYDWMDWMYAKLLDSKWNICNGTWYVHKVWEHYEFIE